MIVQDFRGRTMPLTPEDIIAEQLDTIPDFVIEAVNELLRENYICGSAIILRSELLARCEEKAKKHGIDPKNAAWFNPAYPLFDEMYRSAGWLIEYCTQGKEPYWIFKR